MRRFLRRRARAVLVALERASDAHRERAQKRRRSSKRAIVASYDIDEELLDEYTEDGLRLLESLYANTDVRYAIRTVPGDSSGELYRVTRTPRTALRRLSIGHPPDLSTALSDRSLDMEIRLRAGLVIARILDPDRYFLLRRTESITLQSRNVNERSIFVEMNPAVVKAAANEFRTHADVVPVALLPKEIYLELELRDGSGSRIPIGSRELDAHMAQCHLMAHVQAANPELHLPSPTVMKLLWDCTYRFPISSEKTPSFVERAEERGRHLTGEDREWWDAASATDGWCKLLTNYEESFLLVAPFDLHDPNETLAYRYLENKTLRGPAAHRKNVSAPTKDSKSLSFRLNDVGRARSEHLHLIAPAGTFLADFTVAQRGTVSLAPAQRGRATRGRVAYNLRRAEGADARSATVVATLWPEPQGLVWPIRAIVLSSWLLTFGFVVLRLQEDVTERMVQNLDASIALGLFLPTLYLGWLERPEHKTLRRGLLQPWLFPAMLSVLMVWVDYGLQFVDSGNWDTHIFVTYVITFAGATWLLATIERRIARHGAAVATVKILEQTPPKGRRIDAPTVAAQSA